MIEAFQKFAANAPDYAVYAVFNDEIEFSLEGETILGWFRSEAEADAVVERASNAIDCKKAIVIHKTYLLPALIDLIDYFNRVINGEEFDEAAEREAQIERHGLWPRCLARVLLTPVIDAVCERREQEAAKQRVNAKQRRRRLPIPKAATTRPGEVRPC